MRRLLSVVVLVFAMGVIGLIPSTLAAQDKFPSKPITAIVPFSAGGSSDLLARTVEKIWPKYSTQPLVVVNKPGAGGLTGANQVVQSKPDGYNLYIGYGSGNDVVQPQLMKTPYDPFKDLVPVARLSVHSVIIMTGQGSKFKTLKDLVAWSKKEDKPLTSAVSTKAGAVDITLTALGISAGVKMTTVPFAGSADSVTALAGGHVLIGGAHPSDVLPHIKAGRFIPLAVSTPQRDPVFPKVKTLKELGYNVVCHGSIKGVAVAVGTPKPIVAYLENTFKKVCADSEFKKIMSDMGQPVMYLNGADYTKYLKTVYADYGKLIKDLNISIK